MKKLKNGLLLFFIFSLQLIQAQVETRTYYEDEGLVPREHSVDFTHLKLEVSFIPKEKKVIGKVTEDFIVLRQQLDSVFLDGIRMEYKKVLLDGKEIRYNKSTKGLTIYFDSQLEWDSKHQLTIEYEANPKKGLYFIGWDDESNRSKKQIWTQGQGIDNRHWIPMFDEKNDKLISEMIVTFDEGYKVLSNGVKLKEKKGGEGKKLWHYQLSHPHAPYLIMLGIGKYEIETAKSKSGIPLLFYYYPGEKDAVEPTYRYSVEMFDFFEEEIGVRYPWKVYAQIPVQNFMYGAMENTTATIFGDFYLVNSREFLDRNYVRVNAHELAHQWFGDMVTARASAHHWLQESFATHYDLMYQKEAFGQDHFDWTRRNYNDQSIAASKKDVRPLAHSKAGTVRHYPKGAHILQMLKYVVGREQFNAAVQYYLKKHAYGNVDSKDLLVAFHERLGLSLNWFWEEWVYKGGEPHYSVDFIQEGEESLFHVRQIHERSDLVGLFKMPVIFELHFKDGTKASKKVWIEEESQIVRFNAQGKEIDYVLFDPNSQLMKAVDFSKSTELLIAQAEKAEHMLDRYDALVALRDKTFEGKQEFLMERFKKESFHGIKAEILQQTLPILDEVAEEFMRLGIKDASVEVRKAVLENTLRIPSELEPDYRTLLNDSSYQVIEDALDLLSFYYAQNVTSYLELTKDVSGNRSNNVRVTWLKIAYLNMGNEEHYQELVDYSSNAHEFLCRINAMEAIKELNVLNEDALTHLFEANFSFNSRLRNKAQEIINHFFEQADYKKMILNYVASQEWSDAEFKRVSKYLAL